MNTEKNPRNIIYTKIFPSLSTFRSVACASLHCSASVLLVYMTYSCATESVRNDLAQPCFHKVLDFMIEYNNHL